MKALQCPSCHYYLSSTARDGVWRCYNCDEDFSEEELLEDDSPTLINIRLDPAYKYDPDDIGSLAAALQEEERQVTEMKRVTDGGKTQPLFPYSLDDLKYWVVKRRTGEIVKYTLSADSGIPGASSSRSGSTGSSQDREKSTTRYVGSTSGLSSYSDWCHHDPKSEPVFDWKGKKGSPYPSQQLFIADAMGMRNHKEKFDIVIDCGDVLSEAYACRRNGLLVGDQTLCAALDKYTLASIEGPRVLKIDWDDRKAPLLHPEFWVDLAKQLSGRVLINCQGGHGRSGSALVSLMMVLNPEYGSADAIIHLRAIHCPRAIESAEQHGYLDEVADFLNRPADSKRVKEIKSFHEAFMSLKHPSAKPYQERIK